MSYLLVRLLRVVKLVGHVTGYFYHVKNVYVNQLFVTIIAGAIWDA